MPPALLVRRAAARIVQSVVGERRTFDEALAANLGQDLSNLEPRDVAFARLIAVTTLRRLGQIDDVLAAFLSKPIDNRAPFARATLQTAVAQMLFLDTPAHAVIDTAVRVIKGHRKSQHFSGLTNAVLRRVAEGGDAIVREQNSAQLNTPKWMLDRWVATYGDALANAIADAHQAEPTLDLTLKDPTAPQSEQLEGVVLTTGSVRLANAGRIDALPGFKDGEWWVQDAAAALPARLLGDVDGKRVLDLCAAPGGKTAQLCAAGGIVTALDNSKSRMKRVSANIERLGLNATLVVADAITWNSEAQFDAVLLDAPCSASGTIRRHPDIPLLKSETDIAELSTQQTRMLLSAADRVAPGGRLVFCTCSMEPEEGPEQISAFLTERPDFAVVPLTEGTSGIVSDWITPAGFLRTLPCYDVPISNSSTEMSNGMDGFFAALLQRKAE